MGKFETAHLNMSHMQKNKISVALLNLFRMCHVLIYDFSLFHLPIQCLILLFFFLRYHERIELIYQNTHIALFARNQLLVEMYKVYLLNLKGICIHGM